MCYVLGSRAGMVALGCHDIQHCMPAEDNVGSIVRWLKHGALLLQRCLLVDTGRMHCSWVFGKMKRAI